MDKKVTVLFELSQELEMIAVVLDQLPMLSALRELCLSDGGALTWTKKLQKQIKSAKDIWKSCLIFLH